MAKLKKVNRKPCHLRNGYRHQSDLHTPMAHNNRLSRCYRHPYIVVGLTGLIRKLVFFIFYYDQLNWESLSYGAELGSISANLSLGRGFSSPFSPGSDPSAWFAPLLPSLWAGIFKLLGLFSLASLYAILLIDTLLACGTLILYYKIARLIYRKAGLDDNKYPFITTVILSLWPAGGFDIISPWYTDWQFFMMALAVYATLQWLITPSLRTTVIMALVGAAGMTVTQNTALIFAGGSLYALSTPPGFSFRLVRQIVFIAFFVFLSMAPWTLYNYARMGAFIPFRSDFGIELRQGNSERGTVSQDATSVHPSVDRNELQKYLKMGEVQYEKSALHESYRYILDHPLITTKRTLTRIYLYWCSDLFNQYPWYPNSKQASGIWFFTEIIWKMLFWLSPAIALLVSLSSGWARLVPFRWLFYWILLTVPLPYYITIVLTAYPLTTLPWVLLFAIIAITLKVVPPRYGGLSEESSGEKKREMSFRMSRKKPYYSQIPGD
ncbi:MAG: hypothetical protein KJ950_01500 [Proteobacteria bacterium]|nr:hypothetical protein [Pseudomonadota bacterium]MBU1687325.1 hypothetical protein [Pseudomonadota bacterium]